MPLSYIHFFLPCHSGRDYIFHPAMSNQFPKYLLILNGNQIGMDSVLQVGRLGSDFPQACGVFAQGSWGQECLPNPPQTGTQRQVARRGGGSAGAK